MKKSVSYMPLGSNLNILHLQFPAVPHLKLSIFTSTTAYPASGSGWLREKGIPAKQGCAAGPFDAFVWARGNKTQ
jgi:hypothetical protein